MQTDTYPRSIEKNDIAPYLMFAQSNPEFNYFQKAEAFLKDADNTVVNIYKLSKVQTSRVTNRPFRFFSQYISKNGERNI